MTGEPPDPAPPEEVVLHLVASGAGLDRKVAALEALASQTAALRDLVGDRRFRRMVAEEAFVLGPA